MPWPLFAALLAVGPDRQILGFSHSAPYNLFVAPIADAQKLFPLAALPKAEEEFDEDPDSVINERRQEQADEPAPPVRWRCDWTLWSIVS